GAWGAGGAVIPVMAARWGRPHIATAEDTIPAGRADQIWEVGNGVAPVISPNIEIDDHDPGPGVIGRIR
ncbi:hypothetical protein AB0M20_45290, partial [Actinoplanes sp. NPDC051633]|uniref:hypothetical protein n=1 Tax=Actinoplanes sp. NPDC051633 TaxID=3155670 RepID=UPI0034211F4D